MGKGEETRAAILEASLGVASSRGLEGLTIGELAKSTGMSKSGLFAHFRSKEQLQIAVLDEARDRFVALVVAPALKAPRGVPRLRALFDRWLAWEGAEFQPGGCVFITAAVELDDWPGPVRDRLVAIQRDWVGAIETAVRIAVQEGHFRADLDASRFAYAMWGIALAYRWYARLMEDPRAREHAEAGFERLIESST